MRARRSQPPPITPAAPGAADGRERSLDPRALSAARLSGGIAAAVVGAGSVIGLTLALFTARPPGLAVALLFGGWLLLNGFFIGSGLFWPAVRHRHTSYRVDARGIRIRRGVIWRSEITVPRSRIQHTDISRGPIERSFGLATLILHTAGTEHAAVSLGGLAVEVASDIRNFLIEGGEDDAV